MKPETEREREREIIDSEKQREKKILRKIKAQQIVGQYQTV